MVDGSSLRVLLLTVISWLDGREREMLGFLIEENRVLRRQVSGRRLRLTDDDRRNLAARLPAGPARTARDRDHRHAGHAPMASGAHRASGPTQRRDTLQDALDFVRDLAADGRLCAIDGERRALDVTAAMFRPTMAHWKAD
jgi:hypothetical protein